MSLSSYTIIKSLQSGSYGEVFLATNIHSDLVAIKMIDVNKMRRYRINKQMILDEFSTAEMLSSTCPDSIIKFYEQFEDVYNGKTMMCLVTEYVSGNSLYNYIENNDIISDTKAIWSLFYFLSKGLQCIHANGFAHQDIKPDNIMITDDINIKYIDFGTNCVEICKWTDCENICKTDLRTGTILYNPPEYIDHKLALPGLVGAKCHDIWSLGIVFYEIAFGSQTFPYIYDKSDPNVINTIYKGILNTSKSEINHPYDSDIGKLIKRMLSKNPLSRPDINIVFDDIVKYITEKEIFQENISDNSSTFIMDDDQEEQESDINISDYIDD